MATNEDFVPGLQEQPQDLPPGIERRSARRLPGERSSRAPGHGQGGLRIRLSDNELRAAQLIRERFQLRSTVAVLGFCLRTMAQMVEQGQLGEEDLTAQQPGSDGQQPRTRVSAEPPPDPLARPAKQQLEPPSEDQPPNPDAEADASTADSPRLEEA